MTFAVGECPVGEIHIGELPATRKMNLKKKILKATKTDDFWKLSIAMRSLYSYWFSINESQKIGKYTR
jgi:hypothetical protein